jgi:glucose/arabinose dehydrogenase
MRAILLAFALLVAAGCGGDGGGGGGDGGEAVTDRTSAPDEGEFEVRGLEAPWELAFVDETTMLVTERPGRVRVIEDGRLRERPAATIDVQASGEGGLLGLAVREGFAYVYYTAADGNRVARFPLGDDLSFGAEEVLLDGIPSASFHDGGRIAFGPDGMLYVATGDAGNPEAAADRGSLAGKILRLAPGGGEPEVWSWGHRNPQGLAWADDGTMYAAEHGPSGDLGLCCHDEVNVISRDGFYGWPFRAGRTAIGVGEPPTRARDPLAESGEDTWAPAGAAWLDGSLYVATLRGERLLRISPEGEVTTALEGRGRLRIAAAGPDGCLYVGTSNRDGRGDPREGDDRILRICDR